MIYIPYKGDIVYFSSQAGNEQKRLIKNTPKKGFQTIENKKDLEKIFENLIYSRMVYFSAMTMKSKLGQIITKSNKEKSIEGKAEKFLKLMEELL